MQCETGNCGSRPHGSKGSSGRSNVSLPPDIHIFYFPANSRSLHPRTYISKSGRQSKNQSDRSTIFASACTREKGMSINSTLSLVDRDVLGDQQEEGLHARLTYEDVAAAGPAARPLDFPAPVVFRCTKKDITARDHRSGTIHRLRNVIVSSGDPDTGYLIKKKLAKSVYGSIRLCIVLKRRQHQLPTKGPPQKDSGDCASTFIDWESTDLQVAIKISEFSRIHAMRGKHLEDPIREISAMQLLGDYHPHVLGAIDVMQDDSCLYTVTRYLAGGELYGRLMECYPVARHSEQRNATYDYDESKARVWFQQLLQALYHYQRKGVAHRDVSLENILLDDEDRVVLIDAGLSLRVPYSDPCNHGRVTDVSSGASRRLLISQGQGGKLMYAAPEVVANQEEVDAFAVDLWAAGVVLFVMLVGLAPFQWAHPTDLRFATISRGGLSDLMTSLDIPMSPEARDLLQGFFWRDPRERWTLADVMEHPWVQGIQFKNVTFPSSRGMPRRVSFRRRATEPHIKTGCDTLASKHATQVRLVTPDSTCYF